LRHYLSDPGRAAADLGKYMAARPLVMPRLPQGDGHPVLVLPGLLADDVSTGLLRGRLRRLGYRAHGWKLGRNIGPTARCVQGLEDRMTELADRYGRQVSLIGWSLGGIYARDIARRSPEAVRQVITLGTPFRMARHSQSRAQRAFDRFSHLHVEHRALPLETENAPLLVPATSIYSQTDGIVHCRPVSTSPVSGARTSPSGPVTWDWGTTRPPSGPSPTGSPSPKAPGGRSGRRRRCARSSRGRPRHRARTPWPAPLRRPDPGTTAQRTPR